jgi:hypothetical protein
MNQFHTLKSSISLISILILSSNLRLRSSRWSLYFRFARRNTVCSSSPFRATCPTQITIVNRIILITFSGESISRKYSAVPSSQNYSSIIYLFRQSSSSSLYRFKTNTNETNITYFMQIFLKFNLKISCVYRRLGSV